MSGHVVPVRVYLAVFVSLLILTGLTTAVAFVDMGPFNLVVALVIAVAKMLLVVLFFMHIKYSPPLTRLVLIAAVLWLGIMVTLTLSDELTRGWEVKIQGLSAILPYFRALLP
ncbi:MAG TPA: cytochrome C oxidase subunit IV family protein [Candidatus Acidoferrum sp.]|nr:cytochrome C oxidase subunit IV family protein [Candidatus Acidoferrum sp.]